MPHSNESRPETIPPGSLTPDGSFLSSEGIKSFHLHLLKRYRENQSEELLDQIAIFMERASQAGVYMDEERDRWACQTALDYWANTMVRIGRDAPEASLKDFDQNSAPKLEDHQCPYRGLDQFHPEHAQLFYGRSKMINSLVESLAEHNILPVLGPSGSGKSSVVMAGLIPVLQNKGLPGSAELNILPKVVPGSTPLMNLSRALAPDDPEKVYKLIQDNPEQLAHFLEQTTDHAVVLVVDQFEELFTLAGDGQEQQLFVDCLLALVTVEKKPHRVILTMRDDYLQRINKFPQLQEAFEKAKWLVMPMTAGEIREAIEMPARAIGLKFDPEVIEGLVHDIVGEQAALPLLQFTLLALWGKRVRNRVPYQAYRDLGGGRKALRNVADSYCSGLIHQNKEIAKSILLKLVVPGIGEDFTSQRMKRDTLCQSVGSDVERVLDQLIKKRLVRETVATESGGEVQVELAHEALIRNWPRLVNWLEEKRQKLRRRALLRTAARTWDEQGRKEEDLLRGQLLEEASSYTDLSPLEKQLVNSSYEAAEAALAKEKEAQERELEQAQKLAEEQRKRAKQATELASMQRTRNKRLGWIIGILVFLLGAAIVFLIAAIKNEQKYLEENEKNKKLTNERELLMQKRLLISKLKSASKTIVDNEPRLSANLTLEAWNLSLKESRESFSFGTKLREALVKMTAYQEITRHFFGHLNLRKVAVYRGRKFNKKMYLATAGGNGKIIIYKLPYVIPCSVMQRTSVLDIPSVEIQNAKTDDIKVTAVAFFQTRDETVRLASGGSDGVIRLWSVHDSNGKFQLTQDDNKSIKVKNKVSALAVSPDGRWLAASGQGVQVQIWNFEDSELPSVLLASPSSTEEKSSLTSSLAFSKHESLYGSLQLAAGDKDGNIRLWTFDKKVKIWKFQKAKNVHNSWITDIDYHPFRPFLATVSRDRSMKILDTAKSPFLEVKHSQEGHQSFVEAVAFSPDGNRLATTSKDSTIGIWKTDNLMTGGVKIQIPLFDILDVDKSNSQKKPFIQNLVFLENRCFVGARSDDKVTVWKLRFLQADRVLARERGSVYMGLDVNNAVSPALLATSSINRTKISQSEVSVREASTGQKKLVIHPPASQRAVALSPDAKFLAAAGDDGVARVWSTATGIEELAFYGHGGSLLDVSFSPQGDRLATAGHDGAVMLWQINNGKMVHRLLLEPRSDGSGRPSVNAISFNPDGKQIAVGSSVGSITLWWPDRPSQKIITWSSKKELDHGRRDGPLTGLVFSPSGEWLAGSWRNGNVRLFHKDAIKSQEKFRPTQVFTSGRRASSLTFDPTGKYLAVTGWRPMVGLWPVVSKEIIRKNYINVAEHTFESASDTVFLTHSNSTELVTAGRKLRIHPVGMEALAAKVLQQIKEPLSSMTFKKYLQDAQKDVQEIIIGNSFTRLFHQLIEKVESASKHNKQINPEELAEITKNLDRLPKVALAMSLRMQANELLVKDPNNLKGQNLLHGSLSIIHEQGTQDVRTAAKQIKAQHLRAEGHALAYTGEGKKALKKFKEAHNLIPKLMNPELEIQRIQANLKITEWQQKAYQSDDFQPSNAVTKLRQALSDNEFIKGLPLEKHADRLKARRLIQNGLKTIYLLQRSKNEEARVKINSTLNLLRQTATSNTLVDKEQIIKLANRILAHGYIKEGQSHARKNNIEASIKAFNDALQIEDNINDEIITGNNLNILCWWGGLFLGQRYLGKKVTSKMMKPLIDVKNACNEAVDRGPGRVGIRDSRGVTLCVLAEYQKEAEKTKSLDQAAKDFRAYADQTSSRKKSGLRKRWADAMKKDPLFNPINKDMIKELIKE